MPFSMHRTAWGLKQAIQPFKLLVLQILEQDGLVCLEGGHDDH